MTGYIKYNVVVSEKAQRMLGNHVRFLANVDKKAAMETKKKIMTALHSLAELPERYPFFRAEYIPSNKYHKMVIDGRYMALYQIKDTTVYVDYILDCREDYDWLIH